MPRVRKSSTTTNHETERGDILEDLAATAVEGEVQDATTAATVKMKLGQFCPKPELQDRIRRLVKRTNRVMAEAYMFANFHVRRLVDAGKAIPPIDRNFYYRCIVAVVRSKARPATLGDDFAASRDAFDTLRPDGMQKVNIEEDNQVIASLSISMATMAINHLMLNLDNRLSKYLRWRYPELRGLWSTIIRAILDPSIDVASAVPIKETCSPAHAARRLAAREVIGELRPLVTGLTKQRYGTQARHTLPLYAKMLCDIEAATEAMSADSARCKRPPKAFTLLPTKGSFTTSYVAISTMAFVRLVRDWEGITGNGVGSDHRKIWDNHCNLKLVETRHRRFDGHIATDGCAISILMAKRSSMRCPPSQIDDRDLAGHVRSGANVVGVDPGFTDVVTCSTLDGKVASYSSARYYEAAKFKVTKRRTDVWNEETADLTQSLAVGNMSSMDGMSVRIRALMAVLPELLDHRMAKGYRNMRFMRYVHRNKAIEDICDTVAPSGTPTVVGFGDWSGHQSAVKRKTCGPIEEIKHRLKARPNVVALLDIDEFRTSMTCWCCKNRLRNMVATTTKKHSDGTRHVRRSKVHTVLHCRSSVVDGSSRCGATWNRDVNASRNILELAMTRIHGFIRPAALCRQPFQG